MMRAQWPRPWLATAGVIFVMFVVVGATDALSLQSSRAIVPPYHGSVNKVNLVCIGGLPCVPLAFGRQGCVNATVLIPAHFHLKSGRGGFAFTATAHQCAHRTTSYGWYRWAESTGDFATSMRVPFHGGAPTAFVNVTYNESGALRFHWGACHANMSAAFSGCMQWAAFSIGANAWIDDTTANQYFGPTLGFSGGISAMASNDMMCSNPGGCNASVSPANSTSVRVHSSGSFSWAIPLPLGMIRNHTYQLHLEFSGDAYVYFFLNHAQIAGFTATSQVMAGPRGDGINLASVVVT